MTDTEPAEVRSPADRTRRVVGYAAVAVILALCSSVLVAGAALRSVAASDAARANTDQRLQEALTQLAANNAQSLCRAKLGYALDSAEARRDVEYTQALVDRFLLGQSERLIQQANDVADGNRLVTQLAALRLEAIEICQRDPTYEPPTTPPPR